MLSEMQTGLLELVSKSIFEMKYDSAVSMEIIEEARKQKVELLIYGENAELARNIAFLDECKKICTLMSMNDIPYSLMGCLASSCYYPEPVLRHMDKISFLISAENILKIDELLSEQGYALENRFDSYLYRFSKDGMIYEFKSTFDSIPDNDRAVFCAYYLRDVIEKTNNHNGMIIPSDFHHGLIILLELAKKISTSKIYLCDLCDWAVFVGKVNYEKLYGEVLREIGLYHFACLLTQCCYKIGLHKQLFIKEENEELVNEMLEEILITDITLPEPKRTNSFRCLKKHKKEESEEVILPAFYNDLKLFE